MNKLILLILGLLCLVSIAETKKKESNGNYEKK